MRHGILLVNKPSGLTSHDVVHEVRKILGQKNIGHTGTLDPLASGLLVLVLGEATKLSNWIQGEDKTYLAEIKLGESTSTLDRTGELLSSQPVDLSPEEVLATARGLTGDFDWPIPLYSAKKVDGEELYKKAHRGENVELPLKKMSFFDVSVEDVDLPSLKVKLSCSKGGFIRTWADQMGRKLGVGGGHLTELQRLRVGAYHLNQAYSLEELRERREDLGSSFVGLMELLSTWKTVTVSGRDERLIENGQIPFDLNARLIPEQKQALASGEELGVRVLDTRGELKALLTIRPGQSLKILRVFRLDPSSFSH